MSLPKRRVSYVVPPPQDVVPHLQLPPLSTPRLGSVSPLLIPDDSPESSSSSHTPSRQPCHRLGVAALALDTSTQLVGKSSPEGILYTGGRDGLVISWDLGIDMKKRLNHRSDRASRKWEVLTGWADDTIEEEGEDDDRLASDGDILGDVNHRRLRMPEKSGEIPYEDRWETDLAAFKPRIPSQFRQRAELHHDWVNDIALCNYNQTVVSASSDGTVKAWNPHSTHNPDPTQIGSHGDYVRCLSYCRGQNWVASGSFDRTVKLWDLNAPSAKQPIATLFPPDATAPKTSIYALACDPYGRIIASGSPERVVRMWDPRSGKRTGKLVGHTDNVRAILVSEDAKYMLTGSADASIKLWSLSSQRCLHTFTHHTDSVWSLFSVHPSLEVFYSGDRSGLVCRVDVENCSDVSEGECIVLCQDVTEQERSSASEGVNKIVVMDDNLLWTASNTSSVRRWHIPQRRGVRLSPAEFDGEHSTPFPESPTSKNRVNSIDFPQETTPVQQHPSSSLYLDPNQSFASSLRSLSSEHIMTQSLPQSSQPQQYHFEQGDTLCGIPMDSLVKLVSPNDPFAPFPSSRSRDPEVATLYSAASIMSIPRAAAYATRPPTTNQGVFGQQSQSQPTPPHLHRSTSGPLHASRTDDTFTALSQNTNNPFRASYEDRELAEDAIPLVSEPDSVISGDHGLVRSLMLNDRMHVLTVDTSGEVMVWDIVRGVCQGVFGREEVSAAMATAGGSVGGSHGGSVSGGSVKGSSGRRGGNHSIQANGAKEGGRGKGSAMVGGGEEREKERSPRETLEAVRERIEGEAVIQSWCSTDTKAGVLVVHVSERCFEGEVYADEVGFAGDRRFNEESKLNIGKWVLRNLFIGFIREVQRRKRRTSDRSDLTNDGFFMPGMGRSSATPSSTSAMTPSTHHTPLPLSPPSLSSRNRRSSSSSSTDLPKKPLAPYYHHQHHHHNHHHHHHHHSQQQPQQQQPQQQLHHHSHSHPALNRYSSSSSSSTSGGGGGGGGGSASTNANVGNNTHTTHNSSNGISQIVVCSTRMISAVVPPPDLPMSPVPPSSSPRSPAAMTMLGKTGGGVSVSPLIPLGSPTLAGMKNQHQPTTTTNHGHHHGRGGSGSWGRSGGGSVGGGEDVLAKLPNFGRRRSGEGSLDGGGGGLQQQQQQGGDEGSSATSTVVSATGAMGNNTASKNTTSKAEVSSSPPSQAPFLAVGLMGRLRNLGRSAAKRPTSSGDGSAAGAGPASSSGSGSVATAVVENPGSSESATNASLDAGKTPTQALIAGQLSPPTSLDGPIHQLPNNMTLIISEEASPGYKMVYRGIAGNATCGDMQVLEEVIPMWLMEYVLLNRIYLGLGMVGPSQQQQQQQGQQQQPGQNQNQQGGGNGGGVPPVAKLSFVLLPWNKDPDVEPLPELLNTQQSKLTASRQLRVWKIALHVQEKMEKLTKGNNSASRAPSISGDNIRSRSNSNNNQQNSSNNNTLPVNNNSTTSIPAAQQLPPQHQQHPTQQSLQPPQLEPQEQEHEGGGGEEYEILCNEVVLPWTMTLAAVRQFVWKQSSELVMHYRRKRT